METQEQAQARLSAILIQLVPGISLRIDDRAMAAAFGHDDAQGNAETFARENDCAFRYEAGAHYGDGVGVFGRAYAG